MANPENMNTDTQLENRFKVKILLETNLESDFLVLVQDDLTSFSTSRTVFENHQKRSHLNFSTKLIFLLATLVLAMFKNETFKVIFNNCDWTILWQL